MRLRQFLSRFFFRYPPRRPFYPPTLYFGKNPPDFPSLRVPELTEFKRLVGFEYGILSFFSHWFFGVCLMEIEAALLALGWTSDNIRLVAAFVDLR